MTPNQKQLESYQAGNRETAQIVLADVPRFGGAESLMVRWARLVLDPPAERNQAGQQVGGGDVYGITGSDTSGKSKSLITGAL